MNQNDLNQLDLRTFWLYLSLSECPWTGKLKSQNHFQLVVSMKPSPAVQWHHGRACVTDLVKLWNGTRDLVPKGQYKLTNQFCKMRACDWKHMSHMSNGHLCLVLRKYMAWVFGTQQYIIMHKYLHIAVHFVRGSVVCAQHTDRRCQTECHLSPSLSLPMPTPYDSIVKVTWVLLHAIYAVIIIFLSIDTGDFLYRINVIPD